MSKTTNYQQMSQGVIDESMTELGIAREGLKTIPQKVQAMVRYFKAKSAVLADCTVCGGASDENYRRCPYCGDAGLIDPEDAKSGAAVSAIASNLLSNAAPAKVTRVKKEKASAAPAVALTPPEAGDPELQEPDGHYTVKDLDKAVARAARAGMDASKQIWQFGQAALEIYSKSLWRLRKDDLGNAKYSTFNRFCTEELKMSHTQVYRAMGVSKQYDIETIAQMGSSKLSLTLNQPEDERRRMLEEIKGGASKRDLERIRANNAGTRELPSTDDTTEPTPAQVKKSREVAVMVRAPKSIEIAMLGLDTKGKPATRLSDEPWGEEEHENGVISRYAVRTDPDTGVISLVITRRRTSVS